jgi:DNA-binding transcriptional ArsR family regulator
MQLNISETLTAYHTFCNSYNGKKELKDQLRTEINTGRLLLSLLCENMNRHKQTGCVLLTNIYSIATQTNQSLRTIQRHLKILLNAGVIIEHGKKNVTTANNRYRILFNSKLIQYTWIEDGKRVVESEETLVDNAILELNEKLQSKKLQLPENELINTLPKNY